MAQSRRFRPFSKCPLAQDRVRSMRAFRWSLAALHIAASSLS